MCLAIPCKVVAVDGESAQINHGGNVISIDISMVPDVQVGQYVIMHAGMAIQKYDEKEALETLELLNEILSQEE